MGLLQGDQCRVRQQAKGISFKTTREDAENMQKQMHEHLDAMMDYWLAIEHNAVWHMNHDDKPDEAGPGLDASTLSANSMMELADKLLQMPM
jgi:hypothetical protein